MKVYGVFVGSKWGVTTDRAKAVKAASEQGGTVRSMRKDVYDDGNSGRDGGWDSPTFYALSEPEPLN